MLIATQSKNIAATRQYFDQVLTQGDYYLGTEVNGQWHGKGADRLGLEVGSDVTKEQFAALLAGQHPSSGKQLTQRQRRDRRPGVDFTFSVPKSVSLVWAINDDERIIDALRETVRETMSKDIEPLMQRRVRHGKHHRSEQKSTTGELVYADFLHKTSRPVDGVADPHLHVHAFAINWTFQDGRHYAGQFEEIIRQRPSLQAKFESRLARRLKDQLSFDVAPTRYFQSGRVKAGWELVGLDRSTIEKFSRRTQQVEETARKRGIKDAGKKASLGRTTREKKDTGTTIDALRTEWRSRLDQNERAQFDAIQKRTSEAKDWQAPDISESIQFALDHHLYRNSTVERHQVIATALEHGLTFCPEQMEIALDRHDIIERLIAKHGATRRLITTKEVLFAEKKMIDFARNGRGTRHAISNTDHSFKRDWLNDQQKAAVQHVLRSRDSVLAITGGAGTGKSSLMQEAAEGVRHHGKEVFTFAPSTGAKQVLEEKGFAKAQTVEHLIRNTKLHDQLREQVIWIDEAGLVDVRAMNEIFRIANQQGARVVLSGDTRQHASPRRGEAMRLLEEESGLSIARVEAVQRQKGRYREAVEMISRGQQIDAETGKSGLLAGFDRFESMGKIHEVDPDEKSKQIAGSYLDALDSGRTALIVSPTHAEGDEVTQEIRSLMRQKGRVSHDERNVNRLLSMNLTEAEKSEVTTYQQQTDAIIQFHQNVKGGFNKGERYRVAGAAGSEVEIVSLQDGMHKRLPLAAADRFEVYRENTIGLAAGDQIRFSLGGTAKNGKTRISNGRLDQVKGFDAKGNLLLKSGYIIDKDYGHIDFGYVVTSHASQGKDRDLVIASMGSNSLPAINARTLYVTASRGRQDVMIFVDDKTRVRRAIERDGQQLSATELLRNPQPDNDAKKPVVSHSQERRNQSRRLTAYQRVRRWWHRRTRPVSTAAIGNQRIARNSSRQTIQNRSVNHGKRRPSL
ncbi:relaxase domain-containing protein [Stieleria sp. TO1_6]|uniref:MobF family relaxase n=1 Tax=Stieleria tagensis TaxID=2956795 RepID=UPI00209BB45C|nr:MobF family relaxase [Stieleria tagensis]MCO8122892.1 relaxase domain-containing protein [Stieleria tagensis]